MKHFSDFDYMPDFSIWLSPLEATKHFGCSLQTLYNKKHRGELPDEYLLTDDTRWYIHRDAPFKIQNRGRKRRQMP